MEYNKHMKSYVTKIRIISIALSALFLLSACGKLPESAAAAVPTNATQETQTASKLTEISHENVTLDDMVYKRPDIDAIQSAITVLESDIDANKPAQELIQSYQAVQAQYSHADSMLSLIYLRYAFDVTNSKNR